MIGSEGRPAVHPIEEESYRILAGRLDLSGLDPGPAAVVARVVHATAEVGLAGALQVDAAAVDSGVAALRAGAPLVCDVEMVRAGIFGQARAVCLLGEVDEAGGYPSRSAAAMSRAAARYPDGAVLVIGCAPTALLEVNRLLLDGSLRPALVIGVPVGFVGATESKEALIAAAAETGVPAIVLRGERGGAAVAAAVVNALGRLAGEAPDPSPPQPRAAGRARGAAREPGSDGSSLLLIGHGTRSAAGESELRRFADAVAKGRPEVPVSTGFIEFMQPGLDEAIDTLATGGARGVVAVPLVLLGAGHMKDDGPAALARARSRHPHIRFDYARELGLHPDVLATVSDRVREAPRRAGAAGVPDAWSAAGVPDAVVVVGRGSSDPDANADLAKAARLLADGRGLSTPTGPPTTVATAGPAAHDGPPPLGLVVPAFVSLARPDIPTALDQCARLGARSIAVVPYFLFTGLLVDRIAQQAASWAAIHPEISLLIGSHMGIDPRLVDLVWHRYDEATGGDVHMNCDGCVFRAPLPGYEHRVGMPPFTPSA